MLREQQRGGHEPEQVPLDAGVQGAAGFFATNLGLNSDNSLVQTATYVLTKAAILETIQLIGVGGGLAKLDLMGFQLARLEKQVEEINKKLDVILSAPLKLAVDYMGKSMIHMENGSIADAIKEMEDQQIRARRGCQEDNIIVQRVGQQPKRKSQKMGS